MSVRLFGFKGCCSERLVGLLDEFETVKHFDQCIHAYWCVLAYNR